MSSPNTPDAGSSPLGPADDRTRLTDDPHQTTVYDQTTGTQGHLSDPIDDRTTVTHGRFQDSVDNQTTVNYGHLQPSQDHSAPIDSHLETVQPVQYVPPADRRTVVARERERFGGMKMGAAFFGWLAATGMAVLVLAVLTAAGVAFGFATSANVDQAVQESANVTGTAKTVGLVSAIVLLVILFVAYLCGGYVAGRMARFNGFKQGLGVWLWALITTAIIAGLAAIAGAKYNILANLNLPRIPVDEGSVTGVGIIAILAAVLVTLLGALLGGKLGTRFHRKVDAAGFEFDESAGSTRTLGS